MKKIIFFLFLCVVVFADSNKELQARYQKCINNIDFQKKGQRLQNTEYIVSLYQQLLYRNPTEKEYLSINILLSGSIANTDHREGCHEILMKRSDLLARLLLKKEKATSLTWKILAKNFSLVKNLNLENIPIYEPFVSIKKMEKQPQQVVGIKAHLEKYNLYYGYLHSHTAYSDGLGTPEEAYKMAKEKAGLDFFAVTDHGTLIDLWPWKNDWKKTKQAAQKYNKNNEFVALHGFEWSSPLYGHINVIHSDDFSDSVSNVEVKDIYKWIAERPKTIARFNHPGYVDDYDVEFDHFELRKSVLKQMVGMEMHNGTRSIKYYVEQKGYFGKYNHMNEANRKGWKLAAIGGQDNHGGKWGFKTTYTVGVWAKSLTREGILDAYRERRTFASEDRNLSLSFKMNSAEMGSRLLPGNKKLHIELSDSDREVFTQVSIFRSGNLYKTIRPNKNNPNIELDISTKNNEYYYVFAVQEDGDVAISSPIWIAE